MAADRADNDGSTDGSSAEPPETTKASPQSPQSLTQSSPQLQSSSSPWKDLPRRLATVSIGVPSLILILRHSLTSWLFFQGAHLLCLLEWFALLPDGGGMLATIAAVTANDDDADVMAKEKVESKRMARFLWRLRQKIIPPSLLQLLLLSPPPPPTTTTTLSQSRRLSKWLFLQFAISSIVITILPTQFLPLAIMTFSIALRLVVHLPLFQPDTTSITTMVHSTTTIQQQLLQMQHYQFGFLYLSVGFHHLFQIAIFQEKGGPSHIGYLLFIVWMADTGALVFGRLYGKFIENSKRRNNIIINEEEKKKKKKKKKNDDTLNNTNDMGFLLSFLKSISPGKTIPGLVGAIVTGPLSAMVFPITLNHDNDQCFDCGFCSNNNNYLQKLLLGLLLSLAGIFGDLAESSIKRCAHAKDSGGLLPGHGGILDRFDSLLVAGIVYYYYIFNILF